MTKVSIVLKDDHEQFLREAVGSGSYSTQSEVVATALEILRGRENARRAKREELKQEIGKGIADFENGRIVEFSLDRFLAEMKASSRN